MHKTKIHFKDKMCDPPEMKMNVRDENYFLELCFNLFAF